MDAFLDLVDDVVSRCSAVRTLRTARALTRHYDEALRPVGLTITQFTLLITVAKAEPESISQIGELLSMDRTSVSRNLKLLEKAGLIRRGNESAARKRPVELTKVGRERLSDAYTHWAKAQDLVESKFTQGKFEQAMSSLRALRELT
jgi:DNA-binding MarR family transcriptional regulator